jgi:acetoin utilization deacetylase AcuC-like enzyme
VIGDAPVLRRVLVGSTVGLDDHDTGTWHPERAGRLPAAVAGVDDAGLGDARVELAPRPATRAELARVHDPGYLDALEALSRSGGGELDPDTTTSRGSWATAVAAAGIGLAAIEGIRRGDAEAAFVAVRPPGHHASTATGMGFCLLNNVAVGARALTAAGERVLVVDWDVHHGNGTQDVFWDDPDVLYVSTHQWPAYPGTGRAGETGGPGAPGLTINVPLPPGATGDSALAALDEIAAPVAASFAPTWILISAGFDAHRDDPLADLCWSAGDYAELTARVLDLAPRGTPVVAYLEGGYDLDALRASTAATVAGLAGRRFAPEAPTRGGPGLESLAGLARIRAHRLGARP